MKWHFVLYHEIPPICFWYPLSLGIHSNALQVFDRWNEVGSANNRIYGQDWAIKSVRAHLHPDDDAGVHLGNWCTTRVHLMFAIVRMICFQIATSSSSICSLQQGSVYNLLARTWGKMGFRYILESKFWSLHYAPILVPVSVQMSAKCQRKCINLVKGTIDLEHWVLKLYLFLKAYRRASKIDQTSGSILGFGLLVSVKKSMLPE